MRLKITQFRKNIFSGFLAYGINAIIILFTYPIYLKYLGYELLGLWATFSIIITFAEVGNLGISETMMKFLSQYYYNNDIIKIKEYINTGSGIIVLISFILIAIILPLKHNIIDLLNIPQKYIYLSNNILLYVVLISITQIILSYFKGILAGINHLDISNLMLICTNFIRVLIMIILLYHIATLWSVVIAYLITNLIAIITYLIIIKYYLGFFFINPIYFKKSIFKEYITFGGNISGNKIFTVFFIPLTKSIISRYIGLKEVGYFEISWKMIYQLRNLIQKGYIAFLPKISELYSKSKNKQIIVLIKKSFLYGLILGVLFLTIIFLFGNNILTLWLGNKSNDIIYLGVKILTISSSFTILFIPHYYALLGLGKSKAILFEGIIKTLINFLLLILLLLTNNMNIIFVYSSVAISIIISHLYIFIRYQIIKNKLYVTNR